MDKHVLLPAIQRDESEPLVQIVSLHDASGFLPLVFLHRNGGFGGSLRNLWGERTVSHAYRDNFDNLGSFLAGFGSDLQARSLGKAVMSRSLQLREVNEGIGTIAEPQEAETLLRV